MFSILLGIFTFFSPKFVFCVVFFLKFAGVTLLEHHLKLSIFAFSKHLVGGVKAH